MPEYLSPGVYVEEFEIGAKPIEGVSTSTAGFVGMTRRGPLNRPTLVTSLAEYQAAFGGYLPAAEFGDLRWLPYAVEGFFQNGGRRVYVTRVAGAGARASSGYLPDISGVSTYIDEEAKAQQVTLKLKNPAGLSAGDVVRIKDELQTEDCELVGPAKSIVLDASLGNPYPKDTEIEKLTQGTVEYALAETADAGSGSLVLAGATGTAAMPLMIIDGAKSEIGIAHAVEGSVVTLQAPLRYGHSAGVKVRALLSAEPRIVKKILSAAKPGYSTVPIIQTDHDFRAGDPAKIGGEYFLIKTVDRENIVLLARELRYDHRQDTIIKKLVPALEVQALNEGTWGDLIKVVVRESSLAKARMKEAAVNQNHLHLDTVNGMEKGTVLRLPTTPESFAVVTEVVNTPDLRRVILDQPVTVDAGIVSTVEFALMVSYEEMQEVFPHLSMSKGHSYYVEEVINGASKLITVSDKSTTADPARKIPLPTQDKEPGWKLGGGADGLPDADKVIEVYKGRDDVEPSRRTGLNALKNIDQVSIVAMPGLTAQALQNELIIHCETLKDRFAVLDPRKNSDLEGVQSQRHLYDSQYAALYYPWVMVYDPLTGKNVAVPPSGHIAGVYARTDVEKGVHKAPANEKLNGVVDLERVITTGQQDILNPAGVNCLRVFPGRGVRVWGARTVSSDALWKYVNVRRLFLFMEKSIENGIQWAVFEPNDLPLWNRIRQTVNQFLMTVWRSGALVGGTPEEAFFVKCDRTTMTQDDIDNGRLICIIGVAPVKPAEFVIKRIAQWTAGAQQ